MKKIFDEQVFLEGADLMAKLIARLRLSLLEGGAVHPHPQSGFLRLTHDSKPPSAPGSIPQILQTLQKEIFPNLTHWQSPRFYAYFPSVTSHVAVLADMFAQAFHSPCFSYSSSPSHSEVESLVIDWCAEALGLAPQFTFKEGGGGCIVTSNSQAQIVSVHTAKWHAKKRGIRPDRMVAYHSQFSHSSLVRAIHFKEIQHIREVPCSFDPLKQNYVTDSALFQEMLEKDLKEGLVPIWYGATLGSTATGACDQISLLGPICRKHGMHLSVDAAYMGSLFHLPQYRVPGLQFADVVIVNYSKAMLVGNVGSVLLVREVEPLKEAMAMGLPGFYILGPQAPGKYSIDFKDLNISLGRRMNALKIYFVYRYFGTQFIQDMQDSIRRKALFFADRITEQGKFKLFVKPLFGLVCFQAIPPQGKGKEEYNRQVASRAEKDTEVGYMTPSSQNGQYFLRVVVCHPDSTQAQLSQYAQHLHRCL